MDGPLVIFACNCERLRKLSQGFRQSVKKAGGPLAKSEKFLGRGEKALIFHRENATFFIEKTIAEA
ncbi:MAG: hypothetical protein HFG05_11450 [Oscillibacter sp.]|nr:hypothetical protein [Oscillibacter sp.]